MTGPREDNVLIRDDSVESILGDSIPRPVPSDEEALHIRDQVHAEWQKVAARRRNRRRIGSLAIAASVLITVVSAFNLLRVNGIADIPVASIGKTTGSIYLLGENSELLTGNHLETIVANQILITDDNSGVGLDWENGGSLRIDANSRVEFISRDLIYLHSGQVYFDSNPHSLFGSNKTARAGLAILTDYGPVNHVGTQYMARVDRDALIVNVREGTVSFAAGMQQVTGGKQLRVRGNSETSVVNVKTYGENWEWAERLIPSANVTDPSVHEVLQWISHETGLELQYASRELQALAGTTPLIGSGEVTADPRGALRLWMLGTGSNDWRIDAGVIHIDDIGGRTE